MITYLCTVVYMRPFAVRHHTIGYFHVVQLNSVGRSVLLDLNLTYSAIVRFSRIVFA